MIWEKMAYWFRNLLGLDLLLDALESGRTPPAQAYLNLIFSLVTFSLSLLVLYKVFYLILGVFGKSRKYKEAPMDKKYAFIVPARNEELVIANLIDSVRAMDYPQELVDVIVVADNCDEGDKTAEIARSKGAIVFERHDPAHRTLGFALEFMFKEFAKTRSIEDSYYAYIRLDADNIVATDYLRKLNGCMQNSGFDEAVTYRNAKNLNENVISAACGMNVYLTPVVGLRARSILKTNQQVYGPGACFRSYLLKDGWNWTGLTEDLDIESDLAAKGFKTGYCEEATFYEEEPTSVRMFVRQQMRWSKGNFLSFGKYAGPLIKSFFKKPTWAKYDIFFQFFPYSIVSFFLSLTYNIISLILFLSAGDQGYNWSNFANFNITLLAGIYIGSFVNNTLTIIKEWKHFHLSIGKTLLMSFVFPFYQIINLPVSAISVFMRVKWKHIDHHCVADAKDLMAEEEKKNK